MLRQIKIYLLTISISLLLSGSTQIVATSFRTTSLKPQAVNVSIKSNKPGVKIKTAGERNSNSGVPYAPETGATPVPATTPPPQSPAPVATPAVTPPTSTPTYSTDCSAYLSLVEQYSWPVNTMMAIMQAESSCNPVAYNPTGCYGLFQLFGQDITDPAANIAAAYIIYVTQGLTAWSSYTDGHYLAFL